MGAFYQRGSWRSTECEGLWGSPTSASGRVSVAHPAVSAAFSLGEGSAGLFLCPAYPVMEDLLSAIPSWTGYLPLCDFSLCIVSSPRHRRLWIMGFRVSVPRTLGPLRCAVPKATRQRCQISRTSKLSVPLFGSGPGVGSRRRGHRRIHQRKYVLLRPAQLCAYRPRILAK